MMSTSYEQTGNCVSGRKAVTSRSGSRLICQDEPIVTSTANTFLGVSKANSTRVNSKGQKNEVGDKTAYNKLKGEVKNRMVHKNGESAKVNSIRANKSGIPDIKRDYDLEKVESRRLQREHKRKSTNGYKTRKTGKHVRASQKEKDIKMYTARQTKQSKLVFEPQMSSIVMHTPLPVSEAPVSLVSEYQKARDLHKVKLYFLHRDFKKRKVGGFKLRKVDERISISDAINDFNPLTSTDALRSSMKYEPQMFSSLLPSIPSLPSVTHTIADSDKEFLGCVVDKLVGALGKAFEVNVNVPFLDNLSRKTSDVYNSLVGALSDGSTFLVGIFKFAIDFFVEHIDNIKICFSEVFARTIDIFSSISNTIRLVDLLGIAQDCFDSFMQSAKSFLRFLFSTEDTIVAHSGDEFSAYCAFIAGLTMFGRNFDLSLDTAKNIVFNIMKYDRCKSIEVGLAYVLDAIAVVVRYIGDYGNWPSLKTWGLRFTEEYEFLFNLNERKRQILEHADQSQWMPAEVTVAANKLRVIDEKLERMSREKVRGTEELRKLRDSANSIFNEMSRAVAAMSDVQMEPIGIVLVGEAGCNKTSLMPLLAPILLRQCLSEGELNALEESGSSGVYTRTSGSTYDDAYGNERLIILDDIFQAVDVPGSETSPALFVVKLINTKPHIFDAAAVENKQQKVSKVELVLATDNNMKLSPDRNTKSIVSIDAVVRRFPFTYKVIVNPAYVKSNHSRFYVCLHEAMKKAERDKREFDIMELLDTYYIFRPWNWKEGVASGEDKTASQVITDIAAEYKAKKKFFEETVKTTCNRLLRENVRLDTTRAVAEAPASQAPPAPAPPRVVLRGGYQGKFTNKSGTFVPQMLRTVAGVNEHIEGSIMDYFVRHVVRDYDIYFDMVAGGIDAYVDVPYRRWVNVTNLLGEITAQQPDLTAAHANRQTWWYHIQRLMRSKFGDNGFKAIAEALGRYRVTHKDEIVRFFRNRIVQRDGENLVEDIDVDVNSFIAFISNPNVCLWAISYRVMCGLFELSGLPAGSSWPHAKCHAHCILQNYYNNMKRINDNDWERILNDATWLEHPHPDVIARVSRGRTLYRRFFNRDIGSIVGRSETRLGLITGEISDVESVLSRKYDEFLEEIRLGNIRTVTDTLHDLYSSIVNAPYWLGVLGGMASFMLVAKILSKFKWGVPKMLLVNSGRLTKAPAVVRPKPLPKIKTIQPQMKTNDTLMDDVINKAQENTICFSFEPCGGLAGHFLMIANYGGFGLSHYLGTFEERLKTTECIYARRSYSDPTDPNVWYPICLKTLIDSCRSVDDGEDLCLYTVKVLPCHNGVKYNDIRYKNIAKYLSNEPYSVWNNVFSVSHEPKTKVCTMRSARHLDANSLRFKHAMVIQTSCTPTQSTEYGEYFASSTFEYPCRGDRGDCGLPIISYAPNSSKQVVILGIHCAGNNSRSVGIMVTLDQFQRYEEEINSSVLVEQLNPERRGPLSFSDLDFSDYKRLGIKVGEPTSVFHSSLRKNNLFLSCMGRDTEVKPAMLRTTEVGGNVLDPYEIAYSNYGFNDFHIDDRLMSHCGDILKRFMHVKMSEVRFNGKMSKEQALNGVRAADGSIIVPGLPASTSAGFPYSASSRAKKEFVVDGNIQDTDLLRKMYAKIDVDVDKLSRGVPPQHYLGSFIKDELRSIAKSDSGQSRMIMGCPLDSAIIQKMYFGAVIMAFVDNRVSNMCGPGFNPYVEWSYLYEKFRGRKVIDGDFKKFDGRIYGLCYDIFADFCNEFMSRAPDYEPVDDIIRKNIVKNINTSVHVYRQNGESKARVVDNHQPSGCVLTATANTFIGLLYSMYCFSSIWLEKEYGLKVFDCDDSQILSVPESICCDFKIQYGDDNIVAIPPSMVDYTNQQVYAEHMCRMGLLYTDADKTGVLSDTHKLFDDCSFLKRTTKNVAGHRVGALDLKSIFKMLEWVDKNMTLADEVQIVDTFSMELSAHGYEVFADLMPKLADYCRHRNICPRYVTYSKDPDVIYRTWKNVFYTGFLTCEDTMFML